MEYQTDDADFCTSWLLGLQSERFIARCPRWAAEHQTSDPYFQVSHVLGLVPHPCAASTSPVASKSPVKSQPPEWAKQFESTDPNFQVSELLGLPFKRSKRRRNGGKKDKDAATEQAAGSGDEDENETAQSDDLEASDDYGIAKMIGEEPYEVDEEDGGGEAEKEASGEKASDEAPVLATADFLAMCQNLEEMLTDIERAAAEDDSDTESVDGLTPEECEDDSPARLEWLRQKTVERAENKYLDRLMSLPGLEEAKAMFLHAKAKFQAATRRETSLKKDNFDVCFVGNQGTGKSFLANLYAKYLVSLGVVKPPSGSTGIHKISSYYFRKTNTIDAMTNIANLCGGCIAVLDDAHLIDRDDCNLWNLFTRAKELSGNIVIILAGDLGDGLQDQLSYRAEVENHFPVYKLPNYSDAQLRTIFHGMVRKYYNKKMKLAGEVDDFYLDILIKRLLRGSSEEKFANIWPLKKAFVEAGRRQVERFRQARREGRFLEDFLLSKEDLLGNPPALDPEKSAAWGEMQQLLGMDDVKESILAVVHQVSQNYERELKGLEPLQTSPNRVFLGNPGTGKTTVAKLYAKILADFGILSKGDVIVKKPTDLIDRYIGGSENNTREALASAKGSVLIIDDAHMLDPGSRKDGCSKNGDYRGAILDTLVAEVTGAPGEDRCVILCGYEAHMKEMYANGNPGLARRFPLDTAFVFNDFDTETLGKILDLKLKKEKLVATPKAREVALDMLSRASVRPGFGNGGEVDNLISKAITSRTKRITKTLKAKLAEQSQPTTTEAVSEEKPEAQTATAVEQPLSEEKPEAQTAVSDEQPPSEDKTEAKTDAEPTAAETPAAAEEQPEAKSEQTKTEPEFDEVPIEPEDFDADWDRHTRAIANTRALFDGFIGYEEIINKFESYQYMAQGMRLRGIDPRPYIPFTYVFKGPPGTGKTTTARKLGQIFYDMGLLAAPEVVDVSASQLIGEYCGQTAPKTARLLESALGKVLFIDEAYRLAGSGQGSFAEEAVSELVDAVTKPKFARKLIIVLAGYDEDMDRLMRLNPGIKSRFATEFTFKPLRAEQCIEQLRAVVGKVGITIQDTRDMDANTRNTLVTSLSRMSTEKGWASGRSVETLGEKLIAHIFKECAINGYTGKDLTVTGKDMLTILAGSGVGQFSSSKYASGPMGPRQLMTLKDLKNSE